MLLRVVFLISFIGFSVSFEVLLVFGFSLFLPPGDRLLRLVLVVVILLPFVACLLGLNSALVYIETGSGISEG